uniref:Large ribosomal subunit protein bL20c n=2 Tax=Ignatiaceae TaxID=2682551 RepID=A0A1W6EGS8_9CHLO|nr:ribosomal protein L20 [Pseudocharacium americanum]YP_009367678.1 ribosomal protein L20 [Ignatius tetrasporus]ARK14597.1 ribosomal protein L20 [Pseudocharacium americanum]ARK14686.1 ribosomal protein L20 [Ignatius tetrasporus]
MTRVKRGYVARKRRKKILNMTKGFRGSSSVLFRTANQRNMKALKYAYRDRRQRKRQVRSLWISRINNGVRNYDLNYNKFIHQLKKLNININRKWLSQLAIGDPQVFNQLVTLFD